MGQYFGTDGIRGAANKEPMTPHTILKIAQSFGVFLKTKTKRPKVVIGKDTRVSSYTVENAIAAGLCSVGVDVFFLGPIPTAGVAYLTKGLRASAGIMISASHNPYSDNGIKLFDNSGHKFSDKAEETIEKLIDQDLSSYLVDSQSIGRAKRIDDAIGQYAVFLKEKLPRNLKLDGMKIVIDCANGAAYKVAPKVFEELGAEVTCIHRIPNGFNINLNCGALHTQDLQAAVLESKADIGFAFDGDADRIIIVDNLGKVIDGDQIIALCAIDMKESGELTNNGVCVTIMSNKGFDVAMQKAGISSIRTAVGDRYVVDEMKKRNFVLGGEQSGHIVFLESSTTGDGIIAALKILQIIISKNKKISELVNVMTKFPQVTRNITTKKKIPLEKLPATEKVIRTFEAVLGDEGRVLFRYSGTESILRVTVEGPDLKQLEKIVDEIEQQFRQELNGFNSDKLIES